MSSPEVSPERVRNIAATLDDEPRGYLSLAADVRELVKGKP